MMVLIYCIIGCIDNPKELPPSRLQVASHGSMIQYGDLRGFLVTRGNPVQSILWKVNNITPQIKNCALKQVPVDSKALIVENHIALAQSYLNTSTSPSWFKCTQ